MSENLALPPSRFVDTQASARPQVRQRGARAPASCALRRGAWRQPAGQLTAGPAGDFLASRPDAARGASIISWASSAACSTGPSPRSCWSPRRCRPAGVGKPRAGSRSSSTSPKRDGCSMRPPRSLITREPPNADRPTAPSSLSATGWGCAPVRPAGCASATSTATAACWSCEAASSARVACPARPAHRRTGRAQVQRRRTAFRIRRRRTAVHLRRPPLHASGHRQPGLPSSGPRPSDSPLPPASRRPAARSASFVRGRLFAALVSPGL